MITMIMENLEKNMSTGSSVSVQLISETGKEQFYIDQGFELIPNENSGSALRKIIHK